MQKKRELPKQVMAYMEEWQLLAQGDRVIVGLSGGADSVCLLHILCALRGTYALTLFAVHCNHGLRGEAADADARFVKHLCETWGVPLTVIDIPVAALAKQNGWSTEEAGRNARRAVFEQELRRLGADKIALAHQQNDLAETLLFHLFRGSGLRGLAGIAPRSGSYIHPLLCVPRVEIEQYLKQQELSFCTDLTNESERYTRNRIRRLLLPCAEQEVNSNAVAHTAAAAMRLREAVEYLDMQTQKAVAGCILQHEKETNCCILSVPQLLAEPSLIQKEVLRCALAELGGLKDIGATHIAALLRLCCGATGGKLALPDGMQAERAYDRLILKKNSQKPKNYALPLLLFQKGKCYNNRVTIPSKQCRFVFYGQCYTVTLSVRAREAGTVPPTEGAVRWFDYEALNDDLIVRRAQAGDYLTFHADGCTKRLNRLFIDEKLPRAQREEAVVLARQAEAGHVLWAFGIRAGAAYPVTERTKVLLEVSLLPEAEKEEL